MSSSEPEVDIHELFTREELLGALAGKIEPIVTPVERPGTFKPFNLNRLITGIFCNILSPRTWAWAFSCGLVLLVVMMQLDFAWVKTVIICWCVITVLFIGGKALQDSLNTVIKEKTDVKLSIGK